MPKYKVLKSVAHDTGHHLVSTLCWYDGKYGIEHVRDTARAQGVRIIRVDLASGDLQPSAMVNAQISEFARRAKGTLEHLLRGQGWIHEDLRSAVLEIDLDTPSCKVVLVDDRGMPHVGTVEQWGVSPTP
jgi:hypothetical protein